MSRDEQLIMIRAMKRFGGAFVRALGEAFSLADERNAGRLQAAFPQYIETYGPGSAYFAEMQREEA